MGQFIYAPINPVRLTQIKSFDARYQTLPFDFQEPGHAYTQKYQTDDITKLQCLSDYVPTLKVRDLASFASIATITSTTPLSSIVGQTYTLYEFEIDWNAIGEGLFYLELTYNDGAAQVWQSEAIEIQAIWGNTLLFDYNNSTNQFSALFNTGIVFSLRVEGIIVDYTPEFDDVIYNDQQKNTTKLNAVPYRSFNLYVGNAAGVPNWMGDKINWALACDQVKIDNVYYQNTSGSKWEVKRSDPDGTNFIGLKLPIIEANNIFLQSLKAGTTAPEGFTVVELPIIEENKAVDFSIAGVFKKWCLLKNITVYSKGDPFTLKVGVTPGGNEICTFLMDVDRTNIDRKYTFAMDGVTTVYFSGLTTAGTALADFGIDYLKYDAATVPPGADADPKIFPPCFLGEWEAINDSDLTRDWDLTTGLGKVDTNYYGCAICDGRNGTVDRGGMVSIAYVPNTGSAKWKTGYDVLGTVVGVVSIRQTLAQMAPHSHPISTTNSAAGSNDDTDPIRGRLQGSQNHRGGNGTPGTEFGPGGDGIHDSQTIGIVGGNGDASGLGAPMENRQISIVTLKFKKIM